MQQKSGVMAGSQCRKERRKEALRLTIRRRRRDGQKLEGRKVVVGRFRKTLVGKTPQREGKEWGAEDSATAHNGDSLPETCWNAFALVKCRWHRPKEAHDERAESVNAKRRSTPTWKRQSEKGGAHYAWRGCHCVKPARRGMAWETTGERRKLCICDTAVRGRAKHGCGRGGKQAGPSTSRATPRHHMSCLGKRRKAVRSFAARCTRKTQRKRCESTVGHAHWRQPWSEVWGTWCGWCAGGNEVRNELAGSDGVRPTERGEAGAGMRVANDRPLRRDKPETEAGLASHDAGDQGQAIA
ncbi:hypothetical protein TvY486_0029970 [Trypanosoma vivax Y486]|uniref:Uncharacterized protein n=1 Tax=Trypanosoma vivax (strain Y486) TaxID=1055687 RepID=F9WRP0_TRYVY|nr:hypothetical protein TvY486_0029970 [Trypanosoma vivax Y486]|eukprot:CCD20224.1 hypothetical protein TvY486_0029970 [Trypanosoma vivax Y486]